MKHRHIVPWLAASLAGLFASSAGAHPLGSFQVEASFSEDGSYQLEASFDLGAIFLDDWPAPEGEALADLPIEVEERYRGFVSQYTAKSRFLFDGAPDTPRLSSVSIRDIPDEEGVEPPIHALVLRYEGEAPRGAKSFSWSSSMPLGAYFLTLRRQGDSEAVRVWLLTAEESRPFLLGEAPAPRERLEVAAEYAALGFTHILPFGLDHVLFVLGIFFLGTTLRPMLLQVTAFTLAHTLTLALTIYGVLSLPSAWVEPLIALSIAYVGIENILRPKLRSSRLLLVFGFGLLHGMGFAGVLGELGLPREEFLVALLSFNVGVELGQLAVLGLAFLMVGLWFQKRAWYHGRIAAPVSGMIALVGVYWAVERTFLS